MIHRRSQDIVWGCSFSYENSDDLVLVVTLFYIVICIIYSHQLPFIYLICGCALHQIQPHFCLISQKIPRKIFCRPGGVQLHPVHP